jgi:phage terminase large subunit-like protein
MTDGEKVLAFVEKYLRVPDGRLVGEPVQLLPWQREVILAIYDTRPPIRRVIISLGRKGGKTSLIAMLLLASIAGPVARPNAQIFSAAQSRDQASIVFGLAAKMARMNDDLARVCHVRDTAKSILGLRTGVEYRALSADATTAHGTSPALVIHDELGRVRGPRSELYDALETGRRPRAPAVHHHLDAGAHRCGSAVDPDRRRQGLGRPDHEAVPLGGQSRE